MRYIKTLNEALKDLQKGTKLLEGAERLEKDIQGLLYILEDEGFSCSTKIYEDKTFVRSDGEKSYKVCVNINTRYEAWENTKIEREYKKLLKSDPYEEFVDRVKEVCIEHGYFFVNYDSEGSMYISGAVGFAIHKS